MKNKLLAVVLSVVMIAALLVPMMAISAEDTPTAKIGLGTVTVATLGDVEYVVVPVYISENQDEFFTARYRVISDDDLSIYSFRNGDFKEEYENEFGEVQTIELNLTKKSENQDNYAQVVQDANVGDRGITTASGWLGSAYFVAPTKPGTYTFTFEWSDGTDVDKNLYTIDENPKKVTYTVECESHIAGTPEVTKKADCENAGEQVTKCTECGAEMKKETILALGHVWDNGTVAENVKCGDTADTTYKCLRDGCNATEIKTGDVVKHDMVADAENSKPAKCEEDGVEATKCAREGCDHKETKTIAKLGHNMESDQVAGEAPTCTEPGKVVDKCQREGCDKVEETEIPALGHDMVADEENSKEATCYAEGVEATKCAREDCDHTEKKAIAKTEHAFNGEVKVTKAPTKDAEGEYTVACTNDGCTEVEKKVAKKLATAVENKEDGISFKSEEAVLPEDLTYELNDPAYDEETKKYSAVLTFASVLVNNNLSGAVEVAMNVEGATNFEITTVDADGNEVPVEFTLKDNVLTFNANLDGEYSLTFEEAKTPDTGDSANTVVFAVVALMAVAGLVVVGKKRFAL